MINRLVKGCQDCPFCNYDNEYGYDRCNIDDNIIATGMNQLPKDKPHTLCPLKSASILVKLIEQHSK